MEHQFSLIIIVVLMGVLTWIDFKKRIVPDSSHLLIMGLSVFSWQALPLTNRLIAMLLISVPLLIVALITKGLGGGDIKLFFSLGFLVGIEHIVAILFFAALTSALCGIVLMVVFKKHRKTELPFVPFIAIGVVLTLVFGLGQYVIRL